MNEWTLNKPRELVVVWEVVDDLEVVHPVAGVHGEEVAAGLGGGPVELPVIIYIKCNCYPTVPKTRNGRPKNGYSANWAQ